MKNKVLFIDLDWTLIRPHEAGIGNYIEAESKKPIKSNQVQGSFSKNVNDWKFMPKVLDNLLRYYLEGYRIVIVTNQLGVDFGYQKPAEVHQKVSDVISNIVTYIAMYLSNVNQESPNVSFEKLYYSSDKISYEIYMSPRIRKPSDQIKKIFMEKYDYDPETSLFVGDAAGRILGGNKIEKQNPVGYSAMATFAKDHNRNFNEMMKKWNVEFPGKTVKKYTEFDYEVCDFSDTDKRFAESLGVKFNNETEFLSGNSFISNKTTKKDES